MDLILKDETGFPPHVRSTVPDKPDRFLSEGELVTNPYVDRRQLDLFSEEK